MSEYQETLPIGKNDLVGIVAQFYAEGYRLVQIGCTTLAGSYELNYSFDKDYRFKNFRITVTTGEEVPSITTIYHNAFLYENEIHDLFGIPIKNIAVDYHGTLYRTAIATPFSIGNCPVPEPPKPKKETPKKPSKGQEEKGKTIGRQVVIEKSECTACGACVETCPEVFALEDGAEAATVIKPTGGPEDLIQKAIDGCPASCISLSGLEAPPGEDEGPPSESQSQEPAVHEQQKKEETPQEPSQGQEEKGETIGRQVVIEKSECTACGACVETCPEVFALEDGAEAATVIKPTGGPEDLIQKAIDGCPASCISFTGPGRSSGGG